MKALLVFSLLLVGCGASQRQCTSLTGALNYKCSKSGVEYVQSDSGIAVHYDKSGNVIMCD